MSGLGPIGFQDGADQGGELVGAEGGVHRQHGQAEAAEPGRVAACCGHGARALSLGPRGERGPTGGDDDQGRSRRIGTGAHGAFEP